MANIRKVRAWLLIGSLYAYLTVQAIFVLNFYYNRDYYISEVCIQKENPNNCCQASCVIEKQLQPPENTDTDVPQWIVWLPEFIIADTINFTPRKQHKIYFCNLRITETVNPFILPLERPPANSKICNS